MIQELTVMSFVAEADQGDVNDTGQELADEAARWLFESERLQRAHVTWVADNVDCETGEGEVTGLTVETTVVSVLPSLRVDERLPSPMPPAPMPWPEPLQPQLKQPTRRNEHTQARKQAPMVGLSTCSAQQTSLCVDWT
jgi:hypothetical protein